MDVGMSLAIGIPGLIFGGLAGLIPIFGPLVCGVVMWDIHKIRPLMIGVMIGLFLGAMLAAPPSSIPALYAIIQLGIFWVAILVCWGKAWLKKHYTTVDSTDGKVAGP
jgi:hypothetical protein